MPLNLMMGYFSLRHHVQTDSGAHPDSYPMSTGGGALEDSESAISKEG
jgi:hypothetical protein